MQWGTGIHFPTQLPPHTRKGWRLGLDTAPLDLLTPLPGPPKLRSYVWNTRRRWTAGQGRASCASSSK
jgi:hypothetical protein